MLFARQRVRRLEHKAADVVALLKVRLLLGRLLVLEVRLDERHLDVGELGVQVFRIYLRGRQSALISYKLHVRESGEIGEA